MSFKQERQFGSILSLIFATIALWPLIKGSAVNYYWLGTSVIMIVLVVLFPSLLSPVLRVWLKVGHWVSWVNTRLILFIVYFLLITPIALLLKLFRKDVLSLRLMDSGSYWIKRQERWDGEAMRRQF